ncbi:hypothetical protein BB558_005716 [Smittium angustum]|uniref:Protein phosphatase methylesterase 1 n=1 Tax=Smittium angustum TaxID=133377 RepID=A0A2U1IZP7_SMIAN|nr:hypothetical protein BB558_005716 [Smittium angustum]
MNLYEKILKQKFNGDSNIPNTLKQNFQPSSWKGYFEEQRTIEIDDPDSKISFKVYLSGVENNGTIYYFHHGAGLSALSFGVLAKYIYEKDKTSTILCFDGRGHGLTESSDDENLSLERLVLDAKNLFLKLFENTKRQIIFVGHSMGGAVVVNLSLELQQTYKSIGVAVIDVVEETAIQSFFHIESTLLLRPDRFNSLSSAIKYSVKSGATSNVESACVSVPPTLVLVKSDVDGSVETQKEKYVWRTDVMKSRKYWIGWYTDLSKRFLSLKTSKLLVLAGTGRLDKELMIGQMQGKFQLKLFPGCGHNIQEDNPSDLSECIIEFAIRNRPLDINSIRHQKDPK